MPTLTSANDLITAIPFLIGFHPTNSIVLISIKDEANDYLVTEDSNYIILEGKAVDDLVPGDDSDEIQQESDNIVLFSSEDPFSEGNI